MALTAAQLKALRARASKDLDRDYHRKAREQIRTLRERVKNAKRERSRRAKQARAVCRAAKRDAKRKAREIRAQHLAATQAEIAALRAAAAGTCGVAGSKARARAAESFARAASALDSEQRYYAQIRRLSAKPKHTRAEAQRAARERARESDDQVETNLPRELVPVWHERAPKTRATERASRTEVFLQWVHDHPADVERIVTRDIDAQVAAWVREEREHVRRSKRSRAQLRDEVPF